jgi:hypothetical protein
VEELDAAATTVPVEESDATSTGDEEMTYHGFF